MQPSIMKSHCHAERPMEPSRFARIPADINPPKAEANWFPAKNQAKRCASSERVYQEDMRKREPGKTGASVMPRKKRAMTRPVKLWAEDWAAETTPQSRAASGR